MLVPFQTFFAATAVGKAVNKVTLQVRPRRAARTRCGRLGRLGAGAS